MKTSWLHVSDFHFKGGDPYDRDVVLCALVRSVQKFRERGRRPDLIFATGDVAYSGQASEYQAATAFFDALLAAAGVDKRHLYVIPGNHDIDRTLNFGLARTFGTREEADAYFRPSIPKVHITQKQGAFLEWYNRYFDGIRTLPETSTCGPVEAVDIRGCTIGILPVNSALFCQGDDDHAKLWIGRRCLDAAIEKLKTLGAALKIALVHHPLDWLHDVERSNIRAMLQSNVDLILRGHLHETDVESVAGVTGEALHLAAGAAYQTRRWPNRALYGVAEGNHVHVFPIRYEDEPRELWTVDPSVFPTAPDYSNVFAIPRFAREAAAFDDTGASSRSFHVFLSHSHDDSLWVEALARRLEDECAFRIWLDKWVLVPGQPWQQTMAKGLDEAACCAVCVGTNTPRGWFKEEIERALDMQTRDHAFRVIPLLLPDASMSSMPAFLNLRTWADFRTGHDEEYAFHVLKQGIRGEPIGRWPPLSYRNADDRHISRYQETLKELQSFEGLSKEVRVEYERLIMKRWYEENFVNDTQ